MNYQFSAVGKVDEVVRFAWVCRNIYFNTIERVELTDKMLLTGNFPSWIISNNCEIIAKIKPTGLHDKNGKEIYEGDVLSFQGRICGYVVFQPPFFVIKRHKNNKSWIDFSIAYFENQLETIVGNIYENPELLEKK